MRRRRNVGLNMLRWWRHLLNNLRCMSRQLGCRVSQFRSHNNAIIEETTNSVHRRNPLPVRMSYFLTDSVLWHSVFASTGYCELSINPAVP
jgi:hypothetical protein